GKEIAKPITPPSKTASEEDSDPVQAQRDKEMQKNLALIAKYFKNIYKPTNNNLRTSSNSRNKNVDTTSRYKNDDHSGQNLNGYNAVQNVRNQVAQNPRVQNDGNQNRLISVPRNANLNGNGNLVVARAEGNAAGHNGNQIRCYNCKGVGHFARNCMQASTFGTQTDKALVYDSNRSAEVQDYENYNDNEIFNMFTQEEQYTKQLEPIPEPHQVPQNDNNVISEVTSVEQ
nr:hypothetical protein [Tanacetum cinerariifolium]